MSEYLEKQKQEEQRLEAEKLQKKQLFAQTQTAEAVEKMRLEASAAAESTARHQLEMQIQQLEMAARQEQMAEEQRVTNFRQTVLATLPLLKEEEKAQYLIEQLLPMVEKRYASEKGDVHFEHILKVFKFFDSAQNFFATESDVRQFMIEGKNPKQKLTDATDRCIKARKELEASTSGAGCLALIAAGIAILPVFFGLCFLFTALFPATSKEGVANGGNTLSTRDTIYVLATTLGSLTITAIIFIKVKKSVSAAHSKKLSDLSAKLSISETEMDRETRALGIWSKNHASTWNKIKNKLVDSYLASDDGKKFVECSMKALLMLMWLDCVKTEQTFLPPSARLSDEQWYSALAPKVKLKAELAKQRQSNIRDILLSRLAPNYDTQSFEVADSGEKFIKLALKGPDAFSVGPMSAKEVHEMVASLTEQIQTIE